MTPESPPAQTTAERLKTAVKSFESRLTSYDMLAATVLAMILGHLVQFFGLGGTFGDWLRVPERILWPVFFVVFGYNVGRPLDRTLLIWCAAVFFVKSALFLEGGLFPMPILVTLAIARLVLEPLMGFALQSRLRFWGITACLVYLAPVSGNFTEFGTLVVLLAMAGWLARNREAVPGNVLSVKEFFFVCCFAYALVLQHFYHKSDALPFFVSLTGNFYVFFLLYNFRDRILAAVRRRPSDAVEKVASFVGHKSLQIYAIHFIVIYAVLGYALRD